MWRSVVLLFGVAVAPVTIATPVPPLTTLTVAEALDIGFQVERSPEPDGSLIVTILAPRYDKFGCEIARAVQATLDAAGAQVSIIAVDLNLEKPRVLHHAATTEGYTSRVRFDFVCDKRVFSYEISYDDAKVPAP